MYHFYDRATMAHALTLDLDPPLRKLLVQRFGALTTEPGDLTDHTEFLVVEPGDDEADIIRAIGLSPLVEPIEGRRFGEDGFHPFWDWLGRHDAYYELIVTFGGAFGYVLLIQDRSDELGDLCRAYS